MFSCHKSAYLILKPKNSKVSFKIIIFHNAKIFKFNLKKKSKFEKNGEFYISKNYHVDLTKSMEKALNNLNKNREKRKLKIPKRKVYIDVLEQNYIYELNIKSNKVIKRKKSKIKR